MSADPSLRPPPSSSTESSGKIPSNDDIRAIGEIIRDTRNLSAEEVASILDYQRTHGVRFSREEKLNEAIAEWRVVLEMDPANANARRNIDQAERLLRGLEQRMKK